MNLHQSIIDFYNQSDEDSRLTIGLGPLEFERNKQLITRHLPGFPCVIADVGGGTGHYANWLSSLGHRVKLVDPVPKHIEQAVKRSKRSARSFESYLADSNKLPFENNSADLVILHGPLYHLQEREDRLIALKEAIRIAKIDGVVLGFAITHAASTLAALYNGLLHDSGIFKMCLQELRTGEHFPSENFKGMLPPSFFHRPNELTAEFEYAGLRPLELVAVEGIAWLDGDYFNSWAVPLKKQRLLELVKLTEADSNLLSLSPHIMVAATTL